MKTNVQPGDMARVIAPSPAAGAIVEVLHPTDIFDLFILGQHAVGHIMWDVKMVTAAPGVTYNLISPELQRPYLMPGQVAACADAHLRRIDPLADPEAEPRVTETPVTEHA